MAADPIDEILERLRAVVAWATEQDSRLGYFAAMYRRVTQEVKEAIHEGKFEDGPRMTRLDVIFAERYLAAKGL